MTEINPVWNETKPWLHMVADDTAGHVGGLLPPEGLCFVARVDGRAMADAQGVFETFARVFRFPAYFGWNWPALSDCPRDLSWLPARRYLLVVSRPESLLSREQADLPALLRALDQAGEYWSRPFGHGQEWGGQEVAFNTVFLGAEGASPVLEDAVGSF